MTLVTIIAVGPINHNICIATDRLCPCINCDQATAATSTASQSRRCPHQFAQYRWSQHPPVKAHCFWAQHPSEPQEPVMLAVKPLTKSTVYINRLTRTQTTRDGGTRFCGICNAPPIVGCASPYLMDVHASMRSVLRILGCNGTQPEGQMRTVTGKKNRTRMPTVCAIWACTVTSATSGTVIQLCSPSEPALKK
jgi:hypothetical protein